MILQLNNSPKYYTVAAAAIRIVQFLVLSYKWGSCKFCSVGSITDTQTTTSVWAWGSANGKFWIRKGKNKSPPMQKFCLFWISSVSHQHSKCISFRTWDLQEAILRHHRTEELINHHTNSSLYDQELKNNGYSSELEERLHKVKEDTWRGLDNSYFCCDQNWTVAYFEWTANIDTRHNGYRAKHRRERHSFLSRTAWFMHSG